MSCDRWIEPINESVDGTIDPALRAEVEAHLSTCATCRALAGDLQQIRSTARVLDRLEPPAEAWQRIAARLPAHAAPHAAAWLDWRWLAAAAVLVLVTAGSVTLLWRARTPDSTPAGGAAASSAQPGEAARGNAPNPELVQSIESELRLAEEHYDKAIAGLEQIAKADQPSLDPQVASILQKNLTVIDEAIAESRAALRAQPTSRPAQESLFEALRRKVALLQDTIALMNEMRKGNQAGAARIVEGLDKS